MYIPCSRIGYPKLWKAEGIKNDPTSKPRFGCAIYLDKSDEATKARIDKEIARLSKVHFKGIKPKSKDLPIRDGDNPEEGDENTAGCWILSANRAETQGRPKVIDRNKKPIDSSEASEVYAGCFCDYIVSFFVPKNWNKICISLEVVRKNKEGAPLGAARVDVDTAMPDLDPEADEFEA